MERLQDLACFCGRTIRSACMLLGYEKHLGLVKADGHFRLPHDEAPAGCVCAFQAGEAITSSCVRAQRQ